MVTAMGFYDSLRSGDGGPGDSSIAADIEGKTRQILRALEVHDDSKWTWDRVPERDLVGSQGRVSGYPHIIKEANQYKCSLTLTLPDGGKLPIDIEANVLRSGQMMLTVAGVLFVENSETTPFDKSIKTLEKVLEERARRIARP